MICTSDLDAVFKDLSTFRGDGRGPVIFDTRDRGNYSEYGWPKTSEMLRRADPSGLAEALMLREMVEATTLGSKVPLAQVLREDGFVEKLQAIVAIQTRLDTLIGGLGESLMTHLSGALATVSESFGAPTSREVAICLRDAIFCLDSGLTLRWLECTDTPMAEHVPLAEDIRQFPDTVAFVDALRTTLPFGAHLARVGTDFTAIGIKQPGRIAYLSSLGINLHSGQMEQHRAHNALMAEAFDLDTPVQRYPQWLATKRREGSETPMIVGADTHAMNRLAALPRDRLIWLAMVVEMAAKRMSEAKPADVQLAEALANALPERAASVLPVIFKPNWQAASLTLEEMVASLGFSEWESRFLQPAWEGLSPDVFLPESPHLAGMRLDTRVPCRYPKDFESGMSFSEAEDARRHSVPFVRVASDWVGSKAEIDAARREVFGQNLANYLLSWGSLRFEKLWEDRRAWFSDLLRQNLEHAIRQSCVWVTSLDHYTSGVNIYNQSPQHKGYRPRCIFNRKSEVTDSLLVHPDSAAELVALLGLRSEAALPEELHGWTRQQGWATAPRSKPGPYGTLERWGFRRRGFGSERKTVFEAIIRVNRNNVDISSKTTRPHDSDAD